MNGVQQSKAGDLFALSVFLAVAARRSFQAAAIELNVTRSAVSHSVKSFEQRLGVRLFNRTTRSVSLTEAGERLAAKLRPAMSSITEALQEVDDFRASPSGTVRINASDVAIRMILRPILARFRHAYPQVHLDIVTDGRLGDIVAEGFDAGIRLAEAVPQDMIAVRLVDTVRFAAVASPDYLAARGRPTVPQDLYQHDCIRFRFESGAIYRWEFERHGIAETINVDGPLTLTDQILMAEAAIDGIGIAFVPDFLVMDAIDDRRLERVLGEWCPSFPGVCLYYPGRRHVSSGLRALIDTIRGDGGSKSD
ncbi:DNA-binding transcriptional LysR family regulator [Methylopila capsulata]|uniref:DNA-binding transcriptional LysR family regulator n=1 Tax=Methylopila capsulata TaxID=61654 RepID=A0A9W6IUN9_9HYPH|nr:LysR family transcriptional regulator [Methylopila capsulata]MBM7852690.1 DNA-binding transcriptional LysR family regulator [Methylopila capsulata]GLK56898.1 LysR family transcriptional regulator [Methylopila capsulata]